VSKRRTAFRNRTEYLAYWLLSVVVRWFPLRPLQAVGALGGRALFALRGKHVRWALANLRLAFPDMEEAERRRICAASYAAFGRNAIDFVRAESWSADQVRARVTFEGMEHIAHGLDRGQGVLFVSAHIGNFELAIRAFATRGDPILVVGRPMRNELLYQRIERSRTRDGQVQLIDRKRAAMPVLRAIKRNYLIAVLMDQYVRRSQGVFVPLFGLRCSTSPVVASLALRTGAAVICATIARDGPDHHVVHFSPIEMPEVKEGENEVEAFTAACNSAIEERIRAHPDQWMWGHRRFRYSPDLDSDPYAL